MAASGSAPARPSANDARRVISLIDLTDLNDEHAPDGLPSLVDRALEHGVPAVCVWPEFVGVVAGALGEQTDRGSCLIATVVNFPGGDGTIADVSTMTVDALDAGADEIDLVLPYRRFAEGDEAAAREMIEAIASLVHARTGRVGRRGELKVILETGELVDDDLITRASALAIESGADFIKSSTGKTDVSATLGALSCMIDAVEKADRTIGLKPSGGIRTVAEAMEYLEVVDRRLGPEWATPATFRFGASSLLDDAVGVAVTA